MSVLLYFAAGIVTGWCIRRSIQTAQHIHEQRKVLAAWKDISDARDMLDMDRAMCADLMIQLKDTIARAKEWSA